MVSQKDLWGQQTHSTWSVQTHQTMDEQHIGTALRSPFQTLPTANQLKSGKAERVSKE